MFKITSEKELLECFRPIEREEVILPPEIKFPLVVQDYLKWIEPSGCRVYLVFNERLGAPALGVVFRRDQNAGTAPTMCEWCHSVRAGDSVGLLTATSSSKKRVGIELCRDLSCKDKLQAATPGPMDFAESLTPHQKVRRMIDRMSQFVRREIF